MNTVKIAIPSDQPGGLEARVSEHFGHCDLYTIVEVDADGIKYVILWPTRHTSRAAAWPRFKRWPTKGSPSSWPAAWANGR